MDPSIYATYTRGYQGYIPKVQKEEAVNRILHSKHIPGYQGFVHSIKSENKFGESYGSLTSQSLGKKIPTGSDVPSHMRYTSTTRESFINQRNFKAMSTSELLGVTSRKDVYKKPIPVDTINKFWGIDHNKEINDVIQNQACDQSYNKFWSFVDSNKLDYNEKAPEGFVEANNAFWGVDKGVQEIHPGILF
jgi:hypothetical protein